MPQVVRYGDMCTGHECYPPRTNTPGSPDVFVNGKNCHRVGDGWVVHSCSIHNPPHPPHESSQATGSPNVFVNGKKIARVGDSIACGSSNANGSPNVFANG